MNIQCLNFAGSWMSTDPDTTNGNEDREARTNMKGIAMILRHYCLKSMSNIVHMVTTDLQL